MWLMDLFSTDNVNVIMQTVSICIVSSILHGSYNRFIPWFGIEVYSVPFVD